MTNTETKDRYEALNTFIKSLDISYGATFIPFSKSRNHAEKHKSLNWSVCIAPASGKGTFQRQLVTDYMQGIAHMPDYKQTLGGKKTLYEYEREEFAAEKGRYYVGDSRVLSKEIPKPLLRDVLYSLVVDASVLDYPCYEDWANAFGYDLDSRKGEAIYKACLEIALKLRALIGDTAISNFHELFQDY